MSANGSITGYEPRLAERFGKGGKQRLSVQRLATLLNILPPQAISLDAAAAMLRHEEFYIRFNAGRLLSRRRDAEARAVMERSLRSDEPPSRASVARHLHNLTWSLSEPLIKLALQDKDSRVREAAIYALCDMRQDPAFELMTTVLKTEDDNVREAAAWGLRDCQDARAVPVLEAVLGADDPDVRIKALEALSVTDAPEAKPIVRNAMNDPEPDVKYAATLSLLELAGESWLDELSGVIGRTSGETLKQVLRGFFHATNYLKINVAKSRSADLMIDALETALLDNSHEVRMAAIWPLAWMRHARTPGILKRAYFSENNSDVKAHIVRVAAGLMSAAGEEILADAVNSPDAQVKEAAEKIKAERERSGVVLQFDEDAEEGTGFVRPQLEI